MHMVLPMFYSSRFISTSLFFSLLPLVKCSSSAFMLKPARNHVIKHQGDSQKAIDIAVHGILLWASMGFLMPVGILLIRFSSSKHEFQRTTLKAFFYVHAIFQVCSVLLATAAAVLSIKNFENSFNNCHQRVGLALFGAIYVQVLTGFRRPTRGRRSRCIWYLFHWILGTSVSLVGIFNTYTGLKAYHRKTSRSASLWTILFTVQVSIMAFFYLFLDKWNYIQDQGAPDSNQPNSPTQESPAATEAHRKSNALGTYFSRSTALNKLFQLT